MLTALEPELTKIIKDFLPQNSFREILEHALFPMGKLFRSQLIMGLSADLDLDTKEIYLLCAAIEVHHTYTLIHDDLPCMDDDTLRRGRPCTHIKFSESSAILAGDALLNLSYEILSNLANSKSALAIIGLLARKLGGAGLIYGQFLDLEERILSTADVLEIHTYKTGELFSCTLQAVNILAERPLVSADLDKLGLELGVVFQILDDLLEFDAPLSAHEKSINCFVVGSPEQALKALTMAVDNIERLTDTYELKHVRAIIADYLATIDKKARAKDLLSKLNLSELPIVGLL